MNRKTAAIAGMGILVTATYILLGPGQTPVEIKNDTPQTTSEEATHSPTPTANADVSTATSGTTTPTIEASAEDLTRLKTFDTIVETKNDNDPRLDSDFRNLSDATKALLQARYKAFAPEKRNEKGTAVFLLGRELKSKADFDFMGEVIADKPCLSLENCSKEVDSIASNDDHHLDSGTEVTLSYPQIVALKSLEKVLFDTAADSMSRGMALRQITLAKSSPSRKASALAEEILKRYHK